MAKSVEKGDERRQVRIARISTTAIVISAVVGYFGTGALIWPELLGGLGSIQIPILVLILYFLVVPGVVAVILGTAAFFIVMLSAHSIKRKAD